MGYPVRGDPFIMPLINDIKPNKNIGWILPYFWCETESD